MWLTLPRWRKLAACAQFIIQNSQFPPRPTCPICPTCRTRPTIHNSPLPLYFSIRLPSSSYLNVQPCHFFKWLTYCCFAPAQHYLCHTYTYCRFAPARHYPCLSSVLKRLPVLSLLRHCWLRSPKVACWKVVQFLCPTKLFLKYFAGCFVSGWFLEGYGYFFVISLMSGEILTNLWVF